MNDNNAIIKNNCDNDDNNINADNDDNDDIEYGNRSGSDNGGGSDDDYMTMIITIIVQMTMTDKSNIDDDISVSWWQMFETIKQILA